MLLFYHAILERILKYSITSWYGNLTVQSKSQIAHQVKIAMKIMGVKNYLPPQKIYEPSVISQA